MEFAHNPILDNHIFIPDVEAHAWGDGRIYLYGSFDIQGSINYCSDVYHVYSSEDMIHWTDHGQSFSLADTAWAKDCDALYAPDCAYRDGWYYLYYCVPDGRCGVAKSQSPTGPFTDVGPIEGIWGIDPAVLVDDDGQAYIYWGQLTWGKAAKLKDNMKELADDNPREIMKWGDHEFEMIGVNCLKGLPSRQAEGPFAFEYNGNYYLTYPYVRENTEVLGYAMSKNPMGPYEYKGIIMAEHENGCWTNHHSIVNYKGQWYLFYHHNAFSPQFDKNRSAQIEKLYFNPDGTIQEVKPTLRGVGPVKASMKVHIDRYSAIEGAVIDYLDTTDFFQGWKTVFAKEGDVVTFNELDFGKKAPKKVIFRYKADEGAQVALRAGEKAYAEFGLPASSEWTEYECDLKPVRIKGLHDISVALCSDASLEIDWITFK